MSLLYSGKTGIEAWQTLVHVCRRWRRLVLGIPRRLNMRLFCTPETPARGTLDVWPALPLIVAGNVTSSSGTDNVIAALGQSNRVCQVFLLGLAGRQLEKVLAAMEVRFPEMTVMQLSSHDETPAVIRSWMDLPRVCNSSPWIAFLFRDCPDYSCLLLTLSSFGSIMSLIPGTFHPKRWSISSPCCPASNHFSLNSNPLNLALTGKPDDRLHQNVLSSPLWHLFISMGSSNI
jgi:hypothetical protein